MRGIDTSARDKMEIWRDATTMIGNLKEVEAVAPFLAKCLPRID